MSEFNLADVLDHPEWLEYSSDDGAASASERSYSDNDDASVYSSDEEDNHKSNNKNITKLSAFVKSLGNDDSNVEDQNDGEDTLQPQKKKRRTVVPEKGGHRPENAYGMISSNSQKLNFQDILATLPTEQRASVKKTLKTFTPSVAATPETTDSTTEKKDAKASGKDRKKSTTNDESTTTSSSKKRKSIMKESGPLSAPLPKTIQAKINRRAANEVLEENIDKWDDTVREMKGISRAGQDPNENRLTLPLQVNRDHGASNEQLSSKFTPSNSLESSIQTILTSAKLTGKDNTKAETDAINSLPAAAAAASRQKIYELRQHRELMYRAERKAKLLAKIKSKTYRRILRHSKAKKASALGDDNIDYMSVEQMIEMDQIDGGDRLARAMEKREMERIKERATLKHASKRGGGRKWAQSMAGMMGDDEEASHALRERADRESELRKKISNVDTSDSDSNSDDEDDEDDEEMDEDAIRQNAFDELQQVMKVDKQTEEIKPKGIMGMKFMQRGVESERKRLREETKAFEQELQEQFGGNNDDSDGDDSTPTLPTHQRVEGNMGRRVIAPKKGSKQEEEKEDVVLGSNNVLEEKDDEEDEDEEDEEDDTEIILHDDSKNKKKKKGSQRYHQDAKDDNDDDEEDNANPWLSAKPQKSSTGRQQQQEEQQLVGAGKGGRKVASKVAKVKAATEEAREVAKEDARVSIDLSNIMTINQQKEEIQKKTNDNSNSNHVTTKAEKKKKKIAGKVEKQEKGSKKGNVRVASSGSDSDDVGDMGDEPIPIAGKNRSSIAMNQRDMVARAFANDNVVMEFEMEKQAEIERDAPREEDMTLPGWGAWGGKGVKGGQANKKKFIKKIDGIDASKRKDAKLKNVIINERADKKARKYLVNDLPFPYTSAAQHEYKLTRPMGPEWTTHSIHRNNTAPSVLIKPGTVISPIDRLVT